MSALLEFYRGAGRDARGRTLAEIMAWDDARLEAVHDYIQWLFPLPEASAFNPDAPRLTQADIAAFHADPALREALAGSHAWMLRFYRLPPPGAPFAPPWLTPGNHNYLRISRILRCLHLLGLGAEARRLLAQLEALYAGGAGAVIGARTLDFWRGALR